MSNRTVSTARTTVGGARSVTVVTKMTVEHPTVVTWRQGDHWHRMVFEEGKYGTMMRREYTRGSPDDGWRPVWGGAAIVEDVTIREVVE
jgi:hypothetical protein